MKASKGRDDYWLIKDNDSTWAKNDMIKSTYGGIKHSIHLHSTIVKNNRIIWQTTDIEYAR